MVFYDLVLNVSWGCFCFTLGQSSHNSLPLPESKEEDIDLPLTGRSVNIFVAMISNTYSEFSVSWCLVHQVQVELELLLVSMCVFRISTIMAAIIFLDYQLLSCEKGNIMSTWLLGKY